MWQLSSSGAFQDVADVMITALGSRPELCTFCFEKDDIFEVLALGTGLRAHVHREALSDGQPRLSARVRACGNGFARVRTGPGN
jgi:hypothetical protein